MNMTALNRPPSPRHLTVFVLLLAGSLVAAYALPGAQAPAKKALTIDDYTKWRSHRRPEDLGRREVGGLHTRTHQHDRGRGEAGPAHPQPRDGRGRDRRRRDRRRLLARLDVDRVPGGSGRGAARAREPERGWTGPAGPARPRRAAGERRSPGRPRAHPVSRASPVRQGQTGQAGRGGAAASIPPRRVELRQPGDGGGPILAGHRVVHLLACLDAPRPAPARGRLGRRRRRARRRGTWRRRRRAAAEAAARQPRAGQGNDALLLDLRTGSHQLLGSVAEIAFNRTGELLAFTVNAAVKDADGVFVFDTRNGRTTVLDNDAKMYSRLQWNEAGTGLAVLKGSDVEKMRERDNVLLAFPDITAALKDGASAAVAGGARGGQGRGPPQGLGDQRPCAARLERGQRARLLRGEGAGAGRGHDPPVHRRGGERRRVEHGGRPRPVAPDDPREPGPQLHLPERVRRGGEEVHHARRPDHEGPRCRAGREVGRGPRRARVPRRREAAAGRRLLPREPRHGRAHAHRERPAHGPPRVRHLAARDALPVLEGRQGPGLRLQREHDARAGRHGGAELRRHGRRPPGHEAVLRHRRLRERRQGGHRQPPVRPVAAPARRLGARESDRRPRQQERDAVPARPDRAGGSDRAARRRPARDVRPDQAPHPVGVRRVDEEGRLLRAGRRDS